jgi:hypothetical protein
MFEAHLSQRLDDEEAPRVAHGARHARPAAAPIGRAEHLRTHTTIRGRQTGAIAMLLSQIFES